MSTPFVDYGDGWVELTAFNNALVALVGGGVALATAGVYAMQVVNSPTGKGGDTFPKTNAIAQLIEEGATKFLYAEYKWLSIFVVVVAAAIAAAIDYRTMICFIVGAILSAVSGFIGMKIATKANVRTTVACDGPNGLNAGLKVAFKSGAVMALCVVASGLLGVSLLYLILNDEEENDDASFQTSNVWEYLSGFAFGGSSIALFARVGGGIYTKAADVGADLVGKVEESLAEDSPDNPATIADNVGDNVGDVAGMGADLFESFAGSIIAAATLGAPRYGFAGVALPMWVAGLGAVCSVLGTFMIRAKQQGGGVRQLSMQEKQAEAEETLESLLGSIRFVIYGTSAVVVGATIVAIGATFGFDHDQAWRLFGCVILGLVIGNLIGYFTEYATSYTYTPTQTIAMKSNTGAAPVIIQGLGIGMLSCVPPVIFIAAGVLGTYALADIYGIAIAAVGMLSTLGVTLATDAFGPVADNAGGIAEMSVEEINEEVRETTDALDALGNTTAATGKGFAIGSAVLTALALMTAFAEATGIDAASNGVGVNLLDDVVLPGILLGALLPYVFGALTMLSVGKAAESIMLECRDQLNWKWKDGRELDSQKCVVICTQASLQEMVAPGAIAVSTPVIVGTLLGAEGLLGLLAGAISSGFLLGVMMSNAGGAWDNAKKWVEKNGLDPVNGSKGKGTDYHKAVVVGDTVGDPFKDTSGPALNILIKLMSIVSLVIAPLIKDKDTWEQWWISLIVTCVMILGGVVYAYSLSKLNPHSLETRNLIEKMSRERKGLPAVAGDFEAGADVAMNNNVGDNQEPLLQGSSYGNL